VSTETLLSDAPAAPDTPAPAEPAYLSRARRILSGDVRADDYLPVPDSVRAAVDADFRQFAREYGTEATPEAYRFALNRAVLDHYHAYDVVLARLTDDGVLVLAVTDELIWPVRERLLAADWRGFVLYCSPGGDPCRPF
jgi:hypothetical protein